MRYICPQGCVEERGMSQGHPGECPDGHGRFRYEKELQRSKPLARVSPKRAAERRPRRAAPRPSTPAVPAWLPEGFALGVDQREAAEAVRSAEPYGCWLAQFDDEDRPCTNKLERCHIINRQRVEKAVGAMLLRAEVEDYWDGWNVPMSQDLREELVNLAAWDPRNARLGCTGHHPRFDSNATPRLYVPFDALPGHVLEFAEDWGLEVELERKCPKRPEAVAS
jgi:hypothetical protein